MGYYSKVKYQYTVQCRWTLKTVNETSYKRQHIEWCHLYEMSEIGKFIEIESWLVVAKSWERRSMGNRYEVYGVIQCANILQLDFGNGGRTLRI